MQILKKNLFHLRCNVYILVPYNWPQTFEYIKYTKQINTTTTTTTTTTTNNNNNKIIYINK